MNRLHKIHNESGDTTPKNSNRQKIYFHERFIRVIVNAFNWTAAKLVHKMTVNHKLRSYVKTKKK